MLYGSLSIRDCSQPFEFGGDAGSDPTDWSEVAFYGTGIFGFLVIVAGAWFQNWITVWIGVGVVTTPLLVVWGMITFWAWQLRHEIDECN